MREIEDNTCIKFVETRRPRYKYLTISTKKPYNCASCLLFGLNCPILNSGSVTSTPFCSKHFDCPYYYNSVTMRLKFTLPFCGNLSQRMKALITHELLHVLGRYQIGQRGFIVNPTYLQKVVPNRKTFQMSQFPLQFTLFPLSGCQFGTRCQ